MNFFYTRQPSLTHLKVLGFLCHINIVHEQDKLIPRNKQGMHMRYSETKKGYILLDLTNKSLFVHREVIFRENIFPIKDTEHVQPQLFPSMSQAMSEDDITYQLAQLCLRLLL